MCGHALQLDAHLRLYAWYKTGPVIKGACKAGSDFRVDGIKRQNLVGPKAIATAIFCVTKSIPWALAYW